VDLGVEEHVRGLVRITGRSLDDLRPGASPDLDRLCENVLEHRDFSPAPASVDPS
jgi:hypothetical protein